MIQNFSDDTSKLSPKGIDVIRTGLPRGSQSDDFIVSRGDSRIKGDSNLRRELLPTFGALQNRKLD